MTGPDWFPNRKSGLEFEDLGEETLVYDPDRQKVHALNPTSALIWRLCDGRHQVEGLVKAVCDTYPVEEEQARTDVLKFLEDLRGLGLLE